MNIFELLITDQSKLSTAQLSLQRTLRTTVITLVTGIIVEVGVLLRERNASIDFYSLLLLIIYAILVVVGNALEPILIQFGFTKDQADAIVSDIETVEHMLPPNIPNVGE